MDHRLWKSMRNQCMKRNFHWRPTMESFFGQVTGGFPCGRGSAIVRAKSVKTAATEKAENSIFCGINFWDGVLQMMFLSNFHWVNLYHVWNTLHFLRHHIRIFHVMHVMPTVLEVYQEGFLCQNSNQSVMWQMLSKSRLVSSRPGSILPLIRACTTGYSYTINDSRSSFRIASVTALFDQWILMNQWTHYSKLRTWGAALFLELFPKIGQFWWECQLAAGYSNREITLVIRKCLTQKYH